MRNIFLFIRRYITFLTFLLLQIFALLILFNYNRYHHAVGLGLAHEATGKLNTQIDKLDDYFHQGQENRRVHKLNDSLMNLLSRNYYYPDTSVRNVVDTLMTDTLKAVRKYRWRAAKVVYNTVNAEQNYMQLDRGSKYGIRDDMAVISSDLAVVGVVVNVSPNFSQVMSLLNTRNSVSSAHKKSGSTGKVEWDGKDPRFVQLKGIPQNIDVKIGDTIITSKYSYNFPPGLMVGTIAEAINDPATGFYTIKVKTAADFTSLQQVFIVENLLREEQLQLERETQIKLEQQKTRRR
ncbi:MAG TPA: rod shape-determining protein MreC [Flavisolibacter sp.]|nr:rod shape-determining protein MreC [Flavisolibacter sp.]